MKKERILPWQEQGRWYHFFVESTGTAISITDKDIADASMNGAVLQFPEHFRALNWVVDHDNDAGSAADFNYKKKLYTDGTVGIYLPTASQFTAAHVFVFGYYDELPV